MHNMTNKIPESISVLLNEFTKEYEKYASTLSPKENGYLLRFSSQLFYKWYNSSLVNETYLSPANIVSNVYNSNFSQKALHHITISHDNIDGSFSFSHKTESNENSSFLNDLKSFCDFCSPYGIVFAHNKSWYNKNKTFREKLNIDDPYYIEYLLIMAERLNLISKMPSIGTTVYTQNKENTLNFFSLSVFEAMKIVFDEAVKVAREKLIYELELSAEDITEKDILTFVYDYSITDDIVETIFTNTGLCFDDLSSIVHKDTLTDDEQSLISSAIFLGSCVGKWLLGPLCNYMHILNTLYYYPFNIYREGDCVLPVLAMDMEFTGEIFSCCNYYTLTPFGAEILSVEEPRNMLSQVPNYKFTPDKILEILDASEFFNAMVYSLKNNIGKYVYKFKVYFKNDPSLWKIFEIDSSATLETLSQTVDNIIGTPFNEEYIISYNGIEYVNQLNKRSFAKKENTFIDSLNLKKGDKILYYNSLNSNNNMILNLESISNALPNFEYPRLLKQSREITEKEKFDY